MKYFAFLAAMTALQGAQALTYNEKIYWAQESMNNDECSPKWPKKADVMPPCWQAAITGAVCQANGTSLEHLQAHRDCICNGSKLDDERGCLACKVKHGSAGELDKDFYGKIVTAVWKELCNDTDRNLLNKTWDTIYKEQKTSDGPQWNWTGNERIDTLGNNTDVSQYYKYPDGVKQGPGEFSPVPEDFVPEASPVAEASPAPKNLNC